MAIALLILFLIFLLGAWTGSFVGLLSYRLPRGEKFGLDRSHCETCNHVLNAVDLFPVFGWLVRRGQCHYCGAKVPWKYPAIEFAYGIMFVAVVLYCRDVNLKAMALAFALSAMGLFVLICCNSKKNTL